jgi:hypothetical protein
MNATRNAGVSFLDRQFRDWEKKHQEQDPTQDQLAPLQPTYFWKKINLSKQKDMSLLLDIEIEQEPFFPEVLVNILPEDCLHLVSDYCRRFISFQCKLDLRSLSGDFIAYPFLPLVWRLEEYKDTHDDNHGVDGWYIGSTYDRADILSKMHYHNGNVRWRQRGCDGSFFTLEEDIAAFLSLFYT